MKAGERAEYAPNYEQVDREAILNTLALPFTFRRVRIQGGTFPPQARSDLRLLTRRDAAPTQRAGSP